MFMGNAKRLGVDSLESDPSHASSAASIVSGWPHKIVRKKFFIHSHLYAAVIGVPDGGILDMLRAVRLSRDRAL